MLDFTRKLYDDKENETLIEMAQQLVYHEEEIKSIMNNNGVDEMLQEDMVELALHMSNDYLNQDRPDDISPLQDKRDYFNATYKGLSDEFFKGRLPDINYKETTARSVHELEAQNIYKDSLLDNDVMKQLIEKDPDIEMNVYTKIKEQMFDNSCNSWCEACETFVTKAKEYGIVSNVSTLLPRHNSDKNPMIKSSEKAV